MNKKFISAILAGAMVVSTMGVVASAADAYTPATQENAELEKAGSKSYAIAAQMQAPALNVTLPTAVKAVLNPYGIQVEIEEVGKTGTDGVTSPVYTIANNTTDFGVIVKATASAAVPKGSNAKISEASGLTTDTENKVYAEVKAAIALANANDMKSTGTPIVFKDSAATGYKAEAKELLVLTKAAAANTPEKGYFQISGELSGAPETAFTVNDKVNYTLVLDIEPASAETGKPAATTKVGTGT